MVNFTFNIFINYLAFKILNNMIKKEKLNIIISCLFTI
jgi:Na+/H+ antiporter NhaA